MLPLLIFAILVAFYYSLRYIWESFILGRLCSRAVFITGCDSGFGRLLAVKCARSGLPTFAGCLTEQGMKSLEEETKNGSTTMFLMPVHIDVTSEESVKNAARFVEEHLNSERKLWAVVNNAGIFEVCGYDDWCTINEYEKSLDVNTLGVIRVTHAFMDLLKQSRGRVITATSLLGRIAVNGHGPYSVAKFATEAYMDVLRQEMQQFGIRCSILEPGKFRTTILGKQALRDRITKVWNRLDSARKAEYGGEAFKDLYCDRWNHYYWDSASTSLDSVVNCYYHAITARYPRCRYRIGWDSVVYSVLVGLPTEVLDFLICDVYYWMTGWPLKRKNY